MTFLGKDGRGHGWGQEMRLQNQAVHFLLCKQKKIAPNFYFNSRSVQFYALTRVFLPAPSLSMALRQGKIDRGEQLEQPPRFLPTGALLPGALDVLMTSQVGWRGKNNPKPKHGYIFNVLLWTTKWHCFLNTPQETPAKVWTYNALWESNCLSKELVGLYHGNVQ